MRGRTRHWDWYGLAERAYPKHGFDISEDVPLFTGEQQGTYEIQLVRTLQTGSNIPRALITIELPIRTIGYGVNPDRYQERWPDGSLAGYCAKIVSARNAIVSSSNYSDKLGARRT